MEIVTTSPLPPAEVGARYSVVLQVDGGTAPYHWKCEPGLPQGLTLDVKTGEIAGVPRRAEPLNTRYFTVRGGSSLPEAGRYLDLIVRQADGLVILTADLPAATLGQNYDQSLLASGGKGSYSWNLVQGSSLPAGLTLGADGTIAGKPTAVTPEPSGSFEVEVKDATNPPLSAKRSLVLAVTPQPLKLKTTVLPNAKVLTAYETTLGAEGGIGPLTWMVGPLPPGLSLGVGGVIAGTPTQPTSGGPMWIAVSVRGARSESASGDLSLRVEAPLPPPPPPLFTTHSEVPPGGVSRDLSDADAADLPPLVRPAPAPANQRLLDFLARLAIRPESFAGYVREPRAAIAAALLERGDREALLAGSMEEIWAALHRPPSTDLPAGEDGGAEGRTGSGSLIVIGTGIKTAGQLTIEAIASIAASDHVLYSVYDPVAEAVIRELNGSATSITGYYEEGRRRDETYEAMVRHVVGSVRRGGATCLALYGHPGVFAYPAHEAIRRLRDEGYPARMLPGISAEDCLFADLGVDPGTAGCQSYEATGFLAHRYSIDINSHLILWQPGVAGDSTFRRFDRDAWGLPKLADRLSELYGPSHEAIVYEAAIVPGPPGRISRVSVGALSVDTVSAGSTLYVPPKEALANRLPDEQRW